ncbi:MAG: hypothetical protein ACREU9_11920 [Gammaproteobacteria bacterium]
MASLGGHISRVGSGEPLAADGLSAIRRAAGRRAYAEFAELGDTLQTGGCPGRAAA